MFQREVAQLEFTEALTGYEVFISLSVINEFVEVLVTGMHHGDISVSLDPSERKRVLEALEEAALVIQGADALTDREVATIRSAHTGPKPIMDLIVSVRIEKGLVVFDLAFEGDENEEDWVWVYLTIDQCNWLVESFRKAN